MKSKTQWDWAKTAGPSGMGSPPDAASVIAELQRECSGYNTARKWLIFWTLFIGIGAVAGGLSMIIDPSGKALGIALLIVNGLTNLTAAVFLLKKKKAGVILGTLFGVTLMMWICIHLYMFEFTFMSTAYFVFGVCQTVTGLVALRRLRKEEEKAVKEQ